MTLSPAEIARLDPYQLMAVLGKRVIHPGGRRSTRELLELAELRPEHEVLEVGCGVGETAIAIARDVGCRVVAVDLDEAMLARARSNVAAAGLQDRVELVCADIQSLPFADASFDRVVVEAVTMFVDRARAAAECVRVCRPGGRVLDHEFVWRTQPSPSARSLFEGEVCPGITFEDDRDWIELYERAGLQNVRAAGGPFVLMRPLAFLRDEGPGGTLRFVARAFSRPAYLRRFAWMMRRMLPSMRHLGYVVVAGDKAA